MDQEWIKDIPKIDQELKQKILDIIYWGPWIEKTREDGYTERWIEDEDMTVQAIIDEVQSLATKVNKE